MRGYIELGLQEGATLLCGGVQKPDYAPEVAAAVRDGNFVWPTVFADVHNQMRIARDEVFGPVLAIIPFDSEEQAIDIANGTDFGLVAGVFTQDISRAMRCVRRLRAGQVFVNEWYAGGIETPFGGVGLSGFGREKGQEALYSYVRTKNVAIRVAGE